MGLPSVGRKSSSCTGCREFKVLYFFGRRGMLLIFIRGFGAGLDIQTFWMIIYITILVMVSVLLPFAIYLYESDDDKTFVKNLFSYLEIKTLLCNLIIILHTCHSLSFSICFLRFFEIRGSADYYYFEKSQR